MDVNFSKIRRHEDYYKFSDVCDVLKIPTRSARNVLRDYGITPKRVVVGRDWRRRIACGYIDKRAVLILAMELGHVKHRDVRAALCAITSDTTDTTRRNV